MTSNNEYRQQVERNRDEDDCLPIRCMRKAGCGFNDLCQRRGHCRLADTE